MFSKSTNEVQPMTLEAASDYARQLVDLEARGRGDTEGALFRLEQRYGLGPNQIMHLASGRAKSCDVSLFAKLRLAYLDLCAANVRKLQLKIAIEEATGDDSNTDLADRLRALASEIEAKKAAVR
jgi:hypothetical protein